MNSIEMEGYIAFTGGKLRTDCPYDKIIDFYNYNTWIKGWYIGKSEEETDRLYQEEFDLE
jgi:ribosome modulation factor